MKAQKYHRCDYCNQKIDLCEKYRNQFNRVSEGVYTWKSHLHCDEICLKLKMHDEADEGVSSDDFFEYIQNEFSRIMSENYNEIYESETFKIPPFPEQLNFVLCHYQIKH